MKIGLSTHHVLNESVYKNMNKNNIDLIEMSLGNKLSRETDYKEVKKMADNYGVTLWSFHLPFMPFEELDISKPELKEKTVSYLKELIDRVTDIGVDKFVVHSSGEPVGDNERVERMKCAKDSLFTLSEFAKERGAFIAVEDLPRSCIGRNSDEILDLISAHDSLRVCLDTNHLLSENIIDFIKKVGNKIATTHISDFDLIDEKHWLPGEGKLNWHEIYTTLKDVGYNGPWLYEVSSRMPNKERDLTLADLYRNANEIFDNKTITLIK